MKLGASGLSFNDGTVQTTSAVSFSATSGALITTIQSTGVATSSSLASTGTTNAAAITSGTYSNIQITDSDAYYNNYDDEYGGAVTYGGTAPVIAKWAGSLGNSIRVTTYANNHFDAESKLNINPFL